jgi:hypothetical protein
MVLVDRLKSKHIATDKRWIYLSHQTGRPDYESQVASWGQISSAPVPSASFSISFFKAYSTSSSSLTTMMLGSITRRTNVWHRCWMARSMDVKIASDLSCTAFLSKHVSSLECRCKRWTAPMYPPPLTSQILVSRYWNPMLDVVSSRITSSPPIILTSPTYKY